jgi:hypothetical protein
VAARFRGDLEESERVKAGQGIDNAEIIDNVHARRQPMIPAALKGAEGATHRAEQRWAST